MEQKELPLDFTARMRTLLGNVEADSLCHAICSTEPVTSIRINDAKISRESLELPFDGRVPWSGHGWYLHSRPQFTLDPLFHAGCYYVQEASSMFTGHVLRQIVSGPVSMLDLCAAPGGKSTLAAQFLPEGSMLVANEVQRSRAQVLAENMVKWGHDNVLVSCNTPAQIGASGLQFDVMLTDVPCSGEGMFRKDSVAIQDWSTENVSMCSSRQREIMRDVWPALKPGGYLIYSTCTFNPDEDEENVSWIARELGATVIPVEYPSEWNIAGSYSGYSLPVCHFMPHRTKGEGFFIALLRKNDGFTGQIKTGSIKEDGSCMKMVDPGYDCLLEKDRDCIIARPAAIAPQMKAVSDRLYCLVKGIEVAALKGRDMVPSHALAMSGRASELFPKIGITREQALDYLHGDVLRLDTDTKGFAILSLMQQALGFVKITGGRANNMYPQQWRIRQNVR